MTFEEIGIKPEIVRGLKEDGITSPTHIQQEAIPSILGEEDLIGISNTGSGKTVAFAAPILSKLKMGNGLQVMVLAPTRELAVQISKEFEKFGKYVGVKIATVFGGVGMQPQIDALKVADILVATPGRTLDHLNRGTLNLTKINCIVLDEADKMAEMGFIEDIADLIEHTPKEKQVILFGATIEEQIRHFSDKYMRNPVTAKAELNVKEDLLKQYYYNVKTHEKFSLLVHLLKKHEMGRTLIFCSARNTVDLLHKNLKSQGFKVGMIHGKLTQNRRLQVMKLFNEGTPSILIASAVAARGLHIGDITHVINYDLSNDPEEYIHRIGRTARAGESGEAITLLSDKDYDAFDQIHRRFDVNIEVLPKEDFKKIPFDTGRPQRGRGGSRGGFRGGRGRPRGNSGSSSRGRGRR